MRYLIGENQFLMEKKKLPVLRRMKLLWIELS
jgi:hypothetical protein